jgi:dipeptidyl aminopeptidase/acylaminoacyl peptidase
MQALRMAQALYEAKHPFRFVFFEGGKHAISEDEHYREHFSLWKDWLNFYVRRQETWPSLDP